MSDTPTLNPNDRILGGALIATGLLMVLAMLHHPVIEAPTAEGAVDEILREAPLNQLVHGSAIVIMLLQYYGFSVVRDRAGAGHGPYLSTLMFGAGAFAMVGAALFSGFVTPMLAGAFEGGDLTGFRGLARFSYAANQALAGFGALALAFAGLVSAWPLWTQGGVLRVAAVLGGLTGVTTVLLVTTTGGVDVIAMTVIALGLSLWSATMGVYLLMRQG